MHYLKHTATKKSSILILIIALTLNLNVSAQFEQFADSYSILSTIAGKGEMDDRSVSGWLPEYENGNALDAELTRPHFAMSDTAGNIYIADKDAHGIRKVTPEGIITTIAGTNVAGYNGDGIGTECQLSSPNGMWVKPDGTVYILDLGNNKIRRLNTDGTLETIVDDQEGIAIGRGLWVTSGEDSIFYASSSRIKLWTAQSGIQEYSTGYSSLGNICMDVNGYLVATDRSAHKVYRISKDGGSKVLIAGNGTGTGGGHGEAAIETGLAEVRGVWFLDDNSYFLATHEGSQVWYVDNSGTIYLFLDGRNGDSNHSGDGEDYRTPGYKISEARSVTVDYEGNVIITENDLGYIRKVKNDYTYYYTTSIRQKKETKILSVYPNPASENLTISLNSDIVGVVSVQLIDLMGRIQWSRSYPSLSDTEEIHLKISNVPEGVYSLVVYTNNHIFQKRLIIG